MRLTIFALIGIFISILQPGFAKDASPMHSVRAETSAGPHIWEVELASDDASRSKGLMFRTHMDENKGMLFRFDQTRPVSMWMKNTFISLDMIFIREDGSIATIARETTPKSLDIINSQESVRFVLEINAGQAAKLGLEAGQILLHPWFVKND